MISSISSVSRKAPSTRNSTLTMSRNMTGDRSSATIQTPMRSGICSAATIQFITSAPAMVMATMPVARDEFDQHLGRTSLKRERAVPEEGEQQARRRRRRPQPRSASPRRV